MSEAASVPIGEASPRHGPPLLHDQAPPFRARTTMGERSLDHYRGRWLLFFSHPADFTPVCTSEFVAFARGLHRFQALGCDLLALSVDSLFSHLAWVQSIRERFGVEVAFPLVEDPSMAIARAYGMVHPRATDAATVRAAFVIDPRGVIRAINWYPMTTGRSIEELLRLVAALQTADAHAVSTPAGWHPGDEIILPAPTTTEEAEGLPGTGGVIDWYFRTGPSPGTDAPRTSAAEPTE